MRLRAVTSGIVLLLSGVSAVTGALDSRPVVCQRPAKQDRVVHRSTVHCTLFGGRLIIHTAAPSATPVS